MALLDNTSVSPTPEGAIVSTAGELGLTLKESHLSLVGHVEEIIDDTPRHRAEDIRRARDVVGAGVEGALLGPPQVVADIGTEVKQAWIDYKSTREHIETTGFQRVKDIGATSVWYAFALGYQAADDGFTFPLYLSAQERWGSATAYGIAATAGFGLAAFMGLRQRNEELKKTTERKQEIVDDTSDIKPLIIDAAANSAPLQVLRQANKPREAGEPVKIVTKNNIYKFAASYALVNTGLYAGSAYMPFENDWANFGASLYVVWALQGAYTAVKAEKSNRDTEQTVPYQMDGWKNAADRLGINKSSEEGAI